MSFTRALALALFVFGLSSCKDSRDSKPYPPRTQLDGSPDSCELLLEAKPETLLGVDELAPAERYYGLCLAQTKDWPATGAERSVALEIRSDPAFVAKDLAGFWEREGNGVGMAGGKREEVAELAGVGDYAVWHPVTGGLRLFAYWRREYVLVLTVKGVPQERALPWAQELARAAVQRGSS